MDRAVVVARPLWMKQAEEAKLKDEEEKAAAARAAFDATFKNVDQSSNKEAASSDSEADETDRLASKPIGPVDPSKCTAAGTGVGGGAAGAAASFVVVTKDSDGRRIPHGGDQVKVIIAPGLGVGGVEEEAMVKDHGDGTYTVSYAVAKRGNYMVRVECNGKPILGSPFPVFFSAGSLPLNGNLPSYPNGANQGMSNYSGTMPGLFSGMLGMIPGIRPGASAGVVLPGLGASLGEVCQDYLNGQCAMTDCKFNHPPYSQLMAALAPGSTMGGLSHMPMAPSAAAMAAAQAIVAAQALQAHAAQAQAHSAGETSGSKIHNGSSSHQNDHDKSDSSQHPPLPMMMQQAVAMQQLQFKQALLMQQSMATQQAASRAASMKSATEMASARAAEISKTLKVDGDDNDEKASIRKSISPSRSRAKSHSRSRSPVRYRHGRRSRSPPIRYQRDRHSRSPVRAYRGHRGHGRGRSYYYRDDRNNYQKLYSRRDWLRSRDEPINIRRKRSRSRSRSRTRKSPRASSISPRHHRERKNSPNMHKEEQKYTLHSRRSRSMSKELRENIMDSEDVQKYPQESSRKPVKEVNKVMEKHTDVLQNIEDIKEEKYNKDPEKLDNYRKNLIKTGKGTNQDTAREERIKMSKSVNKDGYSDKMKVSEKSDDILMQTETSVVDEENIKEKRRHSKKSTVDDDGENFTEKKSHRKEKRAYEDEYEMEEKRSHKRDRKPVYSDVKELKEKSHRRKGNEKDYEVDEASKRYKERSKKEHDSDKVDKKKRKYKYGPMAASDSSEGSPVEDVDRDNSTQRKYYSRHNRKYRGVSKSVSPGRSFED